MKTERKSRYGYKKYLIFKKRAQIAYLAISCNKYGNIFGEGLNEGILQALKRFEANFILEIEEYTKLNTKEFDSK